LDKHVLTVNVSGAKPPICFTSFAKSLTFIKVGSCTFLTPIFLNSSSIFSLINCQINQAFGKKIIDPLTEVYNANFASLIIEEYQAEKFVSFGTIFLFFTTK
jgi:hypothetical protein